MDLKSGYPYWAVKNGLMAAFPALREDIKCDIAVVGGGITGALITDELVRHGYDVVVLEERDVGWGSTSASTALLQYEIDTHLVDVAKRYGEEAAVLAYRACVAAVETAQEIARPFRDVDMAPMDSLYYASRARDAKPLAEEFAARLRHGFDVEWLDRSRTRERFGFDAPASILNRPAARVDPYRWTYRLLSRAVKAGARVHDRTPVVDVAVKPRGVTLTTANGHTVRAGHVVMAAGYASQKWLKERVASNRSSYAFITDPMTHEELGPLRETLVWESARPYLYIRPTGDGRLLVGGADDTLDIPFRRDAAVPKKVAGLCEKAQALFPLVPWKPAFSWGGTFAETADGLPFFGTHAQHGPRVLFAMAYGGNGITYSVLGATIIRETIERRSSPLARLFSFARLKR
jgi:glycine/D-amino acid oxidase-like deaminating enzyme